MKNSFKIYSQAAAVLNRVMVYRGGYWSHGGNYLLEHGEYSRPEYKPVRYKDGWGIYRKIYGTGSNPGRVSGRLDDEHLLEMLAHEAVVDCS